MSKKCRKRLEIKNIAVYLQCITTLIHYRDKQNLMIMITISNLSFAYGNNAVLKNISMELKPGNIYGLLGENGVGKTTLLTLLCGLKKPQTGTIDIDGYRPYDRKPSLLTQVYYLSDEVAEITMKPMEFALNYGKFWEGFSLEAFEAMINLFEVPRDNRMDKMSAGQLKKTHISFALASGSRYILMDEPTNGLDIPSKAQFRKALMQYTSEDATVVISTHQVKDLENVIDPVIILNRQDVLLNASIAQISEKLYFEYGTEVNPDALYSEFIPGGCIQVIPNTDGRESKVNIEALFNAVHKNKELFKATFGNTEK